MIWITTNNLPPLDDDDFVLWSKIRLIRFNMKLSRGIPVEPLYTETIKRQLIYRAVELMLSWRTTPYRNTQTPEEVRTIWHEASTDVELFFASRTIFDTSQITPLNTIKLAYERWCIEHSKHVHIKYLTKKLQPYLRRTSSGNGYCVVLTAEASLESGHEIFKPGQETLPTT
jgi:phage/plasmid-associated DNA primase